MTSYTGKRIITIDILSIISRSKDNQEMKFGLSIKHKITYIFLLKHTENETRRLIPDLFLFFKKALYKVKASSQHLSCNIF